MPFNYNPARVLNPGRVLAGSILSHNAMSLDKCPVLIFLKGDLQFLFRVHDNRAVPGDRLADRFAGNQQQPSSVLTAFNLNLIVSLSQPLLTKEVKTLLKHFDRLSVTNC